MKQIRLTKGLFALVSPEDYDFLMQWNWLASNESNGKKWYAIRFEYFEGKRYKIRMHREIYHRMKTDFRLASQGYVVDHINDNSLDNRRENLQLITQRENMLRCPGWKRKAEEE